MNKNNISIRSAWLTDLPQIYKICLETGHHGKDATGMLRDDTLLGQFFAAPYLHFQRSSCFVLDYQGFAVGYILAVTDTAEFNAWLNTEWLPCLRKAYPNNPNASDLENYITQTIHQGMTTPGYAADYPSHLHIDILPVAQGLGFGRRLIETLIQHLQQQGSKGLHLGVSSENKDAIEFYNRLGFQMLATETGAITLVQKLK